MKGAIFNILFNVEGLHILDLFAGTGAIGLEALSRGARHATFVDSSREAVGIIQKNIELCGFGERAKVFPKSVNIAIEYFAKHGQKFDLIFVDPPYLKNLVNPTLEKIADADILAGGGKIIVEHHPKEIIQSPIRTNIPTHQHTNTLIALTDTRKYGQTSVSFLCLAKQPYAPEVSTRPQKDI